MKIEEKIEMYMNEREEKKVMNMIVQAKKLLINAEKQWGQPLFYTSKGEYVDIQRILDSTLDDIGTMSDY